MSQAAITAALAGAILSLAAASASAQQTDKAFVAQVQRAAEAQATDPGSEHLFGDWRGLRPKLGDHGIDLQLDYTTETAWNVSGGRRHGADYAHQIGLAVDVDWEKLAGLSGLSTHTVFVNRAGRNASADYIGDPVIQAQEIYGAGFDMGVKLVSFYAEQSLWGGRVDLAAGRLAVGSDFAASPLYCDFMTLTICGHPRALTSNQGFTDWPTASWGGRIRFRPTADTYVMAGVYESKPFPPGGRTGWDWSTHGQTGQTFPVEVAWEPVFEGGRLPGHYKLGLAYDNSEFPDHYVDAAGQPFLTSGAAPRLHNGRTSQWATADQMFVRNGPGQNDGLVALAAYAHNSPDTSLFEHFVWVGVLDRGFWRARPNDQFGLAVTYYKLSHSLTRREELQQTLGLPFTDGEYGVQSDALVLEANYNIAVYRGIQVQPEIEYFVRPGGQHAVSNSLVLGLKTHVLF
jgi:porin